jgi:hypothetical protein
LIQFSWLTIRAQHSQSSSEGKLLFSQKNISAAHEQSPKTTHTNPWCEIQEKSDNTFTNPLTFSPVSGGEWKRKHTQFCLDIRRGKVSKLPGM